MRPTMPAKRATRGNCRSRNSRRGRRRYPFIRRRWREPSKRAEQGRKGAGRVRRRFPQQDGVRPLRLRHPLLSAGTGPVGSIGGCGGAAPDPVSTSKGPRRRANRRRSWAFLPGFRATDGNFHLPLPRKSRSERDRRSARAASEWPRRRNSRTDTGSRGFRGGKPGFRWPPGRGQSGARKPNS
jgi:hypothetical protein